MTSELQRIRQTLDALVRRERGLLLLRVVLRAMFLGALSSGLITAAAAFRWDRGAAVAALVTLVGVGGWAAMVLPLVGHWRRAGDRLGQARRVEALYPELRGRLLASVEQMNRPDVRSSAAIASISSQRELVTTSQLQRGRVHSRRQLLPLFSMSAFGAFLSLVFALLAPGGPLGTARWWLEGSVASAAVEATHRDADGPHARVGDLVLRYVYPEYTGLEPREIANGTGEAHGPPGTVVEVSARSAEAIETGALVAYEDAPLEVEVGEDGRTVRGAFTIQVAEGTWHFVTYREGQALESRRFKIVPEADLPPEVQIEVESATLEVAADEAIPMTWRARDDYGVRRVVMEVNGKATGEALATPLDRIAEVNGAATRRPVDLGLHAGDHAKLVIAAWDNDAVSGSKAGRSRVIDIVVLGAHGLDQREDERQRELRALLVELLAQSLEEPWPPARRVTAGQLASWGQAVIHRYEPVDDWAAEHFDERGPRSRREALERDLVDRVTRSGRELVRFTQVSFVPNATTVPRDDDLKVVGGLRNTAISELESAILSLDTMVRNRAMEQVAGAAKQMADVAKEVSEALKSGDMSAQEILTRLDQLERALAQLMQDSAQLPDDGLKEFLNQRGQELQSLTAEIRKALAEGRLDEARELMERLARELEQMSQGVEDEMKQRSDANQEQAQKAQELQKELSQLEQEQRDLQKKTQDLQLKGDSQAAEQAENQWERLLEKAAEHVASAREHTQRLEQQKRDFNVLERARNGTEQSGHLRDVIEARDLRGARIALEDARTAWQQADWLDRTQAGGGSQEVERLQAQLDEMEGLLDQLDKASSSVDPATQQQARSMRQAQQDLEKRLQAAQKKAEEVG